MSINNDEYPECDGCHGGWGFLCVCVIVFLLLLQMANIAPRMRLENLHFCNSGAFVSNISLPRVACDTINLHLFTYPCGISPGEVNSPRYITIP